MKNLLLIIFAAISVSASAASLDSIIGALDHSIAHRDYYYMIRETRIDSLKNILATRKHLTPDEHRDIISRIFEEYRSYQGDSAKTYAFMLQQLPSSTPDDRVRDNCALLFVYLSGGLFKEAIDVCERTDLTEVSDDVKGDYYFLLIRLYSDMNNYVNGAFDNEYSALSRAYSDSVLRYKPSDSYEAQYASVFRTIQTLSPEQKIAEFADMLGRDDIDISEKAMISSMLGDFYGDKGLRDSMLYYKTLSADLDIRSAKHETTACRVLATLLFEEGDLERASKLIHVALDDARIFNARHRIAEINNVLAVIEQARYTNMASQRNFLIWVIIGFAILVIALIIAVVSYLRQMKRLRKARLEIEQQNERIAVSHHEIESQNAQLRDTNRRLRESNKIKDEYIGFGFSTSASYMEKIEELYKFVDRKLAAGQYEELRNSLRKRDLRVAKESVLHEFDAMFLRLFPTFIESYNALFPEGEATTSGSSSPLTPEMRIFALIRLGINDSSQIATLLNYSVNTVNTYKTKAKNRSIVANDRFESLIMDIKSVS